MGLKIGEQNRLGKKISELDTAAQKSNPKMQQGKTADGRTTGVVRRKSK